MLLGGAAAKLRGTDLGDLLIQTLRDGGAASRLAAIADISRVDAQAPPVFYVSELETMNAGGTGPRSGTLDPPSRKLQAMLHGIETDQPHVVLHQLEDAKGDLRRAFAIDGFPHGYRWGALRRAPPAVHPHRAPFMGTVRKATTATMEDLALRLDASHVVCLTGPRIVDALFERAGSLLTPIQGKRSPQCRRLTSRGVPFAMLDADSMAGLKDGDHVEIEADRMRVVSPR